MATHNIAQNLRDNNTNWQNVKQAIEDKGVSTSGLTTAEYDDAIRAIETGSSPVLDDITITPSIISQNITPPVGTDGYNEINVEAVDSTIDNNIVAGNIKNGVTILGVTGSYAGGSPNLQNKSVSPSTSQQTVQADNGYDGLDTVTVGAVTSSIDNNIQAGNIKKDVVILGVTGSYEGGSTPVLESKTVSPNFSSGDVVVEPDQGYDGLEDVTITKDSDLVASNIKSGVEIFGITGSYSGGGGTLDDIYDEFVQLAHTNNLDSVNGLVCIDDTLYMYNSGNIYEYDATNDTWTQIVNNVGSSGVGKNAAVAIGTKIVWAWHDSWEDIYYKYYDVDTQTLSNNISISLQGQLSAIETDGTYLYVFDYNHSRIIKIDIVNNTKSYFSISVSERITTLKWFHEKLYGITKTYIYEIDVDAETCTVAYTFGSTPSYDRDAFVSGAGLFLSAGVDASSADKFKIYVFNGTTVTLYKTTTDIYFRNGTYCICNRKLYQLGGNDSNDSLANKFSEIGDNMSITLVITPSQNDILSSFTAEMANVFVKGVTAEVDSDIVAGNIKKDVNILGCVGTYTGDGSTNKTYNFTGEYADRSPVEYEWTVNDIVSHVNIKNVNTGQDTGTWYQVSKSNTTIYVKRSSSGSYEALSSNDWDLVNTGTGSANYYYSIDFDLDEYISAIKIVYDGVYRVSAVTTVQARSITYYGTSAPVSATGYEDGDYYCVYEDYTVSNTVVRKIISQYILLNGTWTQIV